MLVNILDFFDAAGKILNHSSAPLTTIMPQVFIAGTPFGRNLVFVTPKDITHRDTKYIKLTAHPIRKYHLQAISDVLKPIDGLTDLFVEAYQIMYRNNGIDEWIDTTVKSISWWYVAVFPVFIKLQNADAQRITEIINELKTEVQLVII